MSAYRTASAPAPVEPAARLISEDEKRDADARSDAAMFIAGGAFSFAVVCGTTVMHAALVGDRTDLCLAVPALALSGIAIGAWRARAKARAIVQLYFAQRGRQ